MAKVHFSAALRGYTNGVSDVEVEASNVRRLIAALDERFPGIGEPLSKASSVAINGEIIADAEYEEVPDGAEIHFLDMHQGG
ncbi:MAG: MoaD/ThiS family protein [Actinomycetota bacterium]|jgi:sulfur-carrier protein|nr:MoaD/ThiS family protein [Actinomycetota bacterium]